MNLFIKRIMDIFISIIGITILAPVFIIISIAIKLDSKGPVLFVQKRRTKDGKVFSMLKFRSMIVNAEKVGTGLFNYENDPRVTKVGRFLRDKSLDEIPQLFNVLQGSLAIVGPRPPVEYELGEFETLNQKYKKRFQMKAGITGIAQVVGRNDILWDEKVEYDNQYIDKFKTWGVLLDIKIIIQTFASVLRNENIYENKFDESIDDVESARLAEIEIIKLAHMPCTEDNEV